MAVGLTLDILKLAFRHTFGNPVSRVYKVGVGGISGTTEGASKRKTEGCLGPSIVGDHGRKTGNYQRGSARSVYNVGRLGVAVRNTAACAWGML